MFLALREFKHAKLRYILIGSIMVLISFLVLFVSGLAKGLSYDNSSLIQNMKTDYLILEENSGRQMNHSFLTEAKFLEIQQLYKIGDATPIGIQMTTLMEKGSNKKVDATFLAINVDNRLSPKVVEGKMITNITTNEVVADKSLKDEGYKIGDRIKDQISGKEFNIIGFTEGQSYSHTPVIHLNFKEWKSIHQTKSNSKIYNAIAVNTTKKEIQAVKNVSGIDVISKKQALQGIPGYKEEQGSLLMMIVFLFVIGAIVLAVFYYVMTIQKINQFGVLKAIGSKTSYLAKNIIAQVLYLTFASLVISITLTYVLSFMLPSSLPFVISIQLIVGCSVLFLLVAVIGSLLSLYRVAKIDAIEAIGRAF